ncbi:hypothetical protein GGR57DRAFT_498445 [Xylariaceae sp. FL1272]|nr:hypothetical protein GGR57DRAFT_498445 [Xylariaceae sp. FL1272]
MSDTTAVTAASRLPWELIFEIMTCLLPCDPEALIPPSHPATKVLLAFSAVCHSTRRVAVPKLLQHCVYFGSTHKLSRFLNELHTPLPHFPDQPRDVTWLITASDIYEFLVQQ